MMVDFTYPFVGVSWVLLKHIDLCVPCICVCAHTHTRARARAKKADSIVNRSFVYIFACKLFSTIIYL